MQNHTVAKKTHFKERCIVTPLEHAIHSITEQRGRG